MPQSTANSVLPPAWAQVIEQIEQALAAAVSAAEQREHNFIAHVAHAAETEPSEERWRNLFERLQYPVAQAGASVGEAEHLAARTDADLESAEQAVKLWLTAAARRLAE